MTETLGPRAANKMAKLLVLIGIRNTYLERLHEGISPVSVTGDYTDVKVIDGAGTEITWPELARFNDNEMKKLIKECVNRMYTFLLMKDDGKHDKNSDYWTAFIGAWDEPEKDDFIAEVIKKTQLARPL